MVAVRLQDSASLGNFCYFTFLLFVVLSSKVVCEKCDGNVRKNITMEPLKFEDIVPKHYDKLVPPTCNGGPAVVHIKISLLNIQFVDEATQAFGADIFFHQIWNDPRVIIPSTHGKNRLILDRKWKPHLWTPDTYFKNSLDGKVNDIIMPYSYIAVENSSDLFFAARVSLKLSCAMSLISYPHDVQECEIFVMSLQHTNDTVILKWKEFEITKNIFLAQYHIRSQMQEEGIKKYKIGTFSFLVGRIQLSRRVGFFLINKYIPCVLIVCMSFVTFWIPAEAYPARVTLSVTSLLTIVTQQYQTSMPSVSYVVALNIWMLSCIGFVFFSLLEYAFVIAVMNNRGTTLWPFRKLKALFSPPNSPSTPTDGEVGSKSPNHKTGKQALSVSHLTIDKASRWTFPLFFTIFCICYFVYYCQ